MTTSFVKKFKDHSHIPISEIEKMQARHKRDLIQPRINGEINPEFLKEYGAKNIRIDEHDIKQMERKNRRYAEHLARDFEKQMKKERTGE